MLKYWNLNISEVKKLCDFSMDTFLMGIKDNSYLIFMGLMCNCKAFLGVIFAEHSDVLTF